MGVSMRYLADRNDALEVVNDAFIKVFNSIKNFENDKLFKPWLRRIIVNTAIDRRRKDMKLLYHTDLELADNITSHSGAIESLNAADILKLLNGLPEIQRAVFNMYEIDGYSHEEIGQTLQISASSSRVYLTRAKEKLRKAWLQANKFGKTQGSQGSYSEATIPGNNNSI
jgi:RNA polymerase sigma factor (sigma-70 family)